MVPHQVPDMLGNLQIVIFFLLAPAGVFSYAAGNYLGFLTARILDLL